MPTTSKTQHFFSQTHPRSHTAEMTDRVLQHRRVHNLLLIQNLLAVKGNASPFTLILDSVEQSAKPLIAHYINNAKVVPLPYLQLIARSHFSSFTEIKHAHNIHLLRNAQAPTRNNNIHQSPSKSPNHSPTKNPLTPLPQQTYALPLSPNPTN